MSTTLYNKTIVRFAHINKNGGGLEQYIIDLNKSLLSNNKLTIVTMYVEETENVSSPLIEKTGVGTVVWYPLKKKTNTDLQSNKLNWLLYTKNKIKEIPVKIYRKLHIFNNYQFKQLTGPSENYLTAFNNILEKYGCDLLVIHSAGCFDSLEIMQEAKSRKIPVIIQNHFINSRLKRPLEKYQIKIADGIAGVSNIDVPGYIKSRYCNLSDGIDINFYSNTILESKHLLVKTTVLLMPSRIMEGKGQKDMLNIVRILKGRGFNIQCNFAGRIDSSKYYSILKNYMRQFDLEKNCHFMGNLTQSELKNAYQQSDIVVLTSYEEGLGRILVEAQSMSIPVIAYNTGGTKDALLDGKTGYLLKKGCIKLFADRIETLIKDDTKRYEMGMEGRKFAVERFSLNALAKKHAEYYERYMVNK